MTSGKANKLAAVANQVLCSKCGERPRFASLARCRQCLAADTARELAGYDRFRAAQASQRKAARPRAGRKAAVTSPAPPASKALVPNRSDPLPAIKPEAEGPPTPQQWQAWITEWSERRKAVASPADEHRIAQRDLGAELVQKHGVHYRATYGAEPHLRLYTLNNASLEVVVQTFGLMYPELRKSLEERNGKVTDTKTLCRYCLARVKVPCNDNPSRANACPNRSRGNR